MNQRSHISAAIKFLIVAAVMVITALPAFALPNPLSGASTPNGRFIYVPDMSKTGNRIRIIDADLVAGEVNITKETNANTVSGQTAVIDNVAQDGDPYCLVVNKAGTYLYAVISADPADNAAETKSFIKAYGIGGDGKLDLKAVLTLEAGSYPRGCALTASGNYLYVADTASFAGPLRKIRRIKVDPANPDPAKRLTEEAYIAVYGSNTIPYGVATIPGKLYVTSNYSPTGKLLIYDITTESNPTNPASIEGLPQASLVKVSPDNLKVFVRVLDKDMVAATYSDIMIFNTSDNSLYANVKIPAAGNHQVTLGTGYNGSTGYCDPLNHDEDVQNYDAAFDISPDGRMLYFMHYVGVSGNGMWRYNIKVRAVNIADPSINYESNAGVGFHSTDSMAFTKRNRLWAFYSDGGYAQATPLIGPDWLAAYSPTSFEATFTWPTVEGAASYEIWYKISGESDSTAKIATFDAFDVYGPVSVETVYGLKEMSTYEARIRYVTSLGERSMWTPNQWTTPESFYTLESLWVDYGVTAEGATIIYGPLISRGPKPLQVPFAASYEMWYREKGGSWDTPVIIPTAEAAANTNASGDFIWELSLEKDSTYEVIMRTIDLHGMPSEWSSTITFETNPLKIGPKWCSSYNITSHEAVINWGSVEGVSAYQIMYKGTNEVTWHVATVAAGTRYSTADANPNTRLTGLIQLTTYEVMVRSSGESGGVTVYSNWSSPSHFYTLERPWVAYYNPSDTSVYICWGPEISTLESGPLMTVPLADHYQMQYRTSEAIGWQLYTSKPLTNETHGDTSEAGMRVLNFKFDNLITGITYEVAMRSVDSTGGVSDWSTTESGTVKFMTIRAPWWIDAVYVTPEGATITWDPTPETLTDFVSYEFSYGTDTNASNIDQITTGSTIETIGGLTFNTIYYIKVRAIYEYGTSSWSPVGSFETNPLKIGPGWCSSYRETSREAVVNWGSVEGVSAYQIMYKGTNEATWHVATVGATAKSDPDDENPNWKITGLTPLTTYEVMVRSSGESGGVTIYSKWSSHSYFYTLERPWVAYYNPSDTSVYICWGPEISTLESGPIMAVPLADHYIMEYLSSEAIGWQRYTTKPLTNETHDDTSEAGLAVLNFKFDNLVAGITYEVRMRTVDNTGGISKWSTEESGTLKFMTIRAPWWIDVYGVTTNDATFIWDSVPKGLTGFSTYQFTYSTDPNADGGTIYSTVNTIEAPPVPLQANTTYYIKVRAVYSYGTSSWSPVGSFYTMNGPQWISNFSTTSYDTQFNWDPVTGIDSIEVNYGISAESVTWEPWVPINSNISYSNNDNGGPVGPLTKRTWYQARIRAEKSGSFSQWTKPISFYTIPEPYIYNWETTADSATVYWTTVEVEPGVACTSYEVSYGYGISGEGSTRTTTEGYITLGTFPTGSTIYVKVRALDVVSGVVKGYSNWSPYPSQTIEVTAGPVISGIDVTSGYRGTTVLINGSNFRDDMGIVSFESGGSVINGLPGFWTNNQIAVAVPPNAVMGDDYTISIVTSKEGKVAVAPSTFHVATGGVMLDDFEKGAWQYSVIAAGPGNWMVFAPSSIDMAPVDGRANCGTVETRGSATYEIAGGVSPYSNDPGEAGFDLSGCNVIHFWFKGDGSSGLVTFEVVESNVAAIGNQPLTSEVWASRVVIPLSTTDWTLISIPMTTEGAASFELTSYYTAGNRHLDWNMIKGYQLLTKSNGVTKHYRVDNIVAVSETPIPTGEVTNVIIERVGDTPGSGIRLRWDYVSTPVPVDIWACDGAFDTTGSNWTRRSQNVTSSSWTDDAVAVGDGNIKWYLVVPVSAHVGYINSTMISAGVLGKWDYAMTEGDNFISLPFEPFNISINNVLGNQLTGGNVFLGTADKIQTIIDGTLASAYLNSSGLWQGTLASVEADRGYLIKIVEGNPGKTVTVVGKTVSGGRTIKLSGGPGTENLIGSSYPINVPLNSSNLAPYLRAGIPYDNSADKIYEYEDPVRIAYKSIYTGLLQGSLTEFVPGRGYRITRQDVGDVYWVYPKLY